MSLMLEPVFEQTKQKYHLELLAGGRGLYRSLRWLYFTEDISNDSFLRGGELFVITGFSFQGGTLPEEFLRTLIKRQACGLIINTGKYVWKDKIPQKLLDLCESEDFPLISMPWEHHLSDVLQEYSHYIFSYAHVQDKLSYIFQLLLSDPKLYSADDETRLLSAGFEPSGTYQVAVLNSSNQAIEMTAENQLNQTETKFSLFSYDGKQILVFYQADDILTRLQEILNRLRNLFPQYAVTCGVGSTVRGIKKLAESFRNGTAALTYAKHEEKPLAFFDELGIYRLFLSCDNGALLDGFGAVLRPLEDYDAKYHSLLLETLRIYLQCNGSVQTVSAQMYCHRNTTNYRIQKIADLLGFKPDSSAHIFELQMAFYLREYRDIFKI
ncbi:MAG: PucR family transcriptional regulator ligand-binding domain-containing protein [Evtepia sp.]